MTRDGRTVPVTGASSGTPTSSRVLIGTFGAVPDRLADAPELRAAGLRG